MSTKRQYTRPYVGVKGDGTRVVFRLATTPTEDMFRNVYNGVIGPFHTTRGANYMAQYGRSNPHLLTVRDAERAAVRETAKAAGEA